VRHVHRLKACFLACLCAGLLVAPRQVSAEPPHGQEVDPFIGTADEGRTFPGATVPFGMVQFSPDTRVEPGGYEYHDSVVQGFSLTHLSGAGCVAYQDIPILPTDLPVTASPAAEWSRYASHFSHANESAAPGYYSVRLDASQTQVELTATPRTGMARFHFPQTPTANMLFNVSGSGLGAADASVELIGNTQLAGRVSTGGFCGSEHAYTLYFAAQFDRPFAAWGTWTDSGTQPGSTAAAGPQSGAYVAFDARQTPLVQVKVGVSFVSSANAQLNLQHESPGWDFDAVRAAAAAAWEEQLGHIQVEGGSPAQRKTFYTALYHAFLHPNVFSDVNGEYQGFDDQVHLADGYEQYANFSGWDIYRTQVPLLAWLAPRQTSDMLRSLLADAQQGGALPRWPLANDETGTMAGDPSAVILASAYAFGADLDLDAAWQAAQWGADTAGARSRTYEIRPGLRDYVGRGYVALGTDGVRGAAATTLEYAIADFAIARLAEARGDAAARARYMWRAQSWEQLFDPDSGFIHPRVLDGTFMRGFDPDAGAPFPGGEQLGFLEGDTWQYTWMVPFNLQALILGLGGPGEATRRLDSFFDELNAGPIQPHAWMGNEPSFGAPWVYAFAGAPSHTQQVVNRIRGELFAPTPGGLPGNDDLGATSAWYVWAALGLYPSIPGVGGFVLSSPLFPAAVVQTGQGASVRITAQGGPGPYVRSLLVNGGGYSRTWLPLEALPDGATLQYTLSPRVEAWGSNAEDAPPSFAEGERPAIGFSSLDLEEVRLAPGQTRSFTLGVRNMSSDGRRVEWSVEPPEGVWLDPARGALDLAAGAAGTVQLAIGATEDAEPWCGVLGIGLRSVPDGLPLPGPVLGVRVAGCE
jgi:predicted alpha-1,2-mannosidase